MHAGDRPLLLPGTALISAAAVVLAPSTAPETSWSTSSVPSIELTASAPLDLVDGVSSWLLPALTPVLDTLPAVPAVPDVGDTISILASATGNFLAPVAQAIQSIYTGVEPWVEYGVNLVAWAAGWVPLVGLLAPQINIFYDLGESIVESLLFNTTDFLAGLVSFSDGLSDIASATVQAIHTFITAEIDWLLPPLPPISLSAAGLDLAAAGLPQLLTSLGLGVDALPALGGDLLGNLGGTLGDLLLNLIP